MIDIDYYRKIQNAYGSDSMQLVKKNAIKQQLNNDFNNTLDAYTVTIDDIEQDLTIIKTTDLHIKKIKSRPNESFKAGQIVFWQNSHWIITTVDTDNSIVTQGKMTECNYILYWQNDNGEIINRYVYVEDFTKYSNGEAGNNAVTLGDNQYGVSISIDDETKKLRRGKRFVFDFQDLDEPDVYALTNRKITLYNYENIDKGGIIVLVFSFNTFNKNTDKKITLDNGLQIWICDYNSSTTPSIPPAKDIIAIINGGNILKCGRTKEWHVSFTDKESNPIIYSDYKWNIKSDFEIIQIATENAIQLIVDNDAYIDETFLLQVLDNNDNVLTEIVITIEEGY